MIKSNPVRKPLNNHDLAQVIEPLANYICAADRPRAALKSALAALYNEVKQTNRTAVAYFGELAEAR